jgi:hypothetical protein
MLRNLISKWRCFYLICVLQVRRWSRCSPRYLTLVRTGICTLFIVTCCQTARVVVNVIWEDFSWLIAIFHVSNHSCRRSRWVWRCRDATSGSEWVANSPVSSAKVAMLVWSVVGRSAVKTRYSKGPRTLPFVSQSKAQVFTHTTAKITYWGSNLNSTLASWKWSHSVPCGAFSTDFNGPIFFICKWKIIL